MRIRESVRHNKRESGHFSKSLLAISIKKLDCFNDTTILVISLLLKGKQ
jgi:hypothetical protein